MRRWQALTVTIAVLLASLGVIIFVPTPVQAAFPSIADTATSLEDATNKVSHTVSLPPNIVSGNLLIVVFVSDGNPSITFPNEGTDWIVLKDMAADGNAARLKVCYRDADGGEGATITVTTASSQRSAHVAYRITGHSTTQSPEASTGASGDDRWPDPDSLTPTGGAKDYLWIAIEGHDRDRDVAIWPSGYALAQLKSVGGGANSASTAAGGRNRNIASEDPGTFSIMNGDNWAAVTVAIHPVGGPSCDAITVNTSDASGSLYFNETIEPDGLPWTTEENVSASYQTGAVPALSVTNDASIACDISVKLITDAPSGATLKYSDTSTAPNPGDNTVPTDPSSVTVCSDIAASGTCDIWLWTDYSNAGVMTDISRTIRVESS